MNKKGQALVEFILVIPIFIMLVLSVFDYVNIIKTKIELESVMEKVILDDKYIVEKDIKLDKKKEGKYKNITLKKDVDIISPVLVAILKDPYEVEIVRSIYE